MPPRTRLALFFTVFVLALTFLTPPADAARLDGLERSVVRITNYSQRPDWNVPWNASGVQESTGSGFVVAGGLIMTNAHVVSDSRLLLVHLYGDPQPYEAEAVYVAHDCDLALIRPVEPATLDEYPPLEFGGLPSLGSTVDTIGFPAGGIQLSSTRGIVSRVEERLYVHSGVDVHLAVQTDAAVNPGASGGPVVQDGEVVGVAFQTNLNLENVGFFIPTEVTGRFLRDVADGSYGGYPELGIETANLENEAIRRRLEMGEGQTGHRVHRVYPGSSSDGYFAVGDIVLKANGREVANDGTVGDEDRRMPFGLLIDRMFLGDVAHFEVLRKGRVIELDIPLASAGNLSHRGHAYDRRPEYYIYGGLVFVPLSREMVKTYGANWLRDAPRGILDAFLYQPLLDGSQLTRPRVVLMRRLDHPVNADMAWHRNQIVEKVNGRPVQDLDDLIRALEDHDGEFQIIEYAHVGRFGVLDREQAERANAEILQRYGIPEDRNP